MQCCLSLRHKCRQRELAKFGFPNHVEACRFNEQDVARLCHMMDDACTNEIEAEVLESPDVPTGDELDELLASADDFKRHRPRQSAWLNILSAHREGFDCIAFTFVSECEEVWMFQLALQSPETAILIRLQLQQRTLRAFEAGHHDEPVLAHHKEFTQYPLCFATEDTAEETLTPMARFCLFFQACSTWANGGWCPTALADCSKDVSLISPSRPKRQKKTPFLASVNAKLGLVRLKT